MKNELITEIVNNENVAAFCDDALNYGLNLMARRRRAILIKRVAALVVLPLVLVISVFWSQRTQPRLPQQMAVRPSFQRATVAGQKVQIISDEELLALFPGKSVALIGGRGQQQFLIFSSDHLRKE